MMKLSRYHQSILDVLDLNGICSAQERGEVEALFRGLTGECVADATQIWRHITSRILLPSHDFAVHIRLAAVVYDGWPTDVLGRPPLWLPDPSESSRTNLARFLISIQGESWWRAACHKWIASSAGPDVGGGGREELTQLLQHHHHSHNHQQTQTQTQRALSEQLLLLQWRLLQRASWEDPEGFWPAVLKTLDIRFAVPPKRSLQMHPSDPDQCRWLPGARLNIAACALDSPRALPETPALLWAPDGAPRALCHIGREELRTTVRQLTVGIRREFKLGDAVALYLPMTPHAVSLYLALVFAGCVVVSVADSFSAEELRSRLDISGTVGLFTQDVVLRGGKALPLYDKVVKSGTKARAVVLPAVDAAAAGGTGGGESPAQPSPPSAAAVSTLRPGDLHWADFLRAVRGGSAGTSASRVTEDFQPHVADMYDITNVLFSSGTTGEPKAIPWTHLTPLRCALDGWAQLDIRPGSVVAWPTSLGWMMGPWLLYAAMLNGATVALYGGAPLGRDFLQFVEAARVDVLGLVPSIVKAWRHGGVGTAAPGALTHGPVAATDDVDLSCVRVFGSTGEASAAEDYAWLMSRVRGYRPVVEYCGGTEIGGGYVSGTLLHPCAPSTFTTATLGARLVLMRTDQLSDGGVEGAPALVWDGTPCRTADLARSVSLSGEVALAMPMLGASQRLLNKNHYQVYYAGMPMYGNTGMPLRRHGDEMSALPASGPGPAPWAFCALGRCDDTMNLGGIKVASLELERAVVEGVAGVAEAAAVGLAPPQGGPEELTLFVVLQPQHPTSSATGDSRHRGRKQHQNQQHQDPYHGSAAPSLERQCQEALRNRLNPLFKVSRVVVVPSLPRNASNKVMRRVLRDALVQGQIPDRSRL